MTRRELWPLLLLAMAAARSGAALADERPAAGRDTLKQRLSDKASDEQRVNDCKVAPERRTRRRPSVCPEPGEPMAGGGQAKQR
jgi:hypothetical protein